MAKRKPLADHLVRYKFTAAYLKELDQNGYTHDMVMPLTVEPTSRRHQGDLHFGSDRLRDCVFVTDARGNQSWIWIGHLQPINGYLAHARGR